jgi:hypothetical protein
MYVYICMYLNALTVPSGAVRKKLDTIRRFWGSCSSGSGDRDVRACKIVCATTSPYPEENRYVGTPFTERDCRA